MSTSRIIRIHLLCKGDFDRSENEVIVKTSRASWFRVVRENAHRYVVYDKVEFKDGEKVFSSIRELIEDIRRR